MLSLSEVRSIFEKEFSTLLKHFNVFELSINEASNSSSNEINSPGVYIFWHPSYGVIKVGKSQSNSKKRSLEHLRDNTSNSKIEMGSLRDDPKTKLLLLNAVNFDSLHWVLSLEAFMEWNTKPLINAARMG